MIIKVQTEVVAPEGSTHYFGNLLDEPTFCKVRQVAGFDHWFEYQNTRKGWVLIGYSKPHWVKDILPGINEVTP